ncbi:MAG: response regulator [bacterium]
MAKKILIVEDETDLSLLCKTQLEKAGYDVVPAYDGEQGLKLAQTVAPDLILLDLKLPLLDGLNICETLKSDEKFKQIPIIITSARKSDYERELGLSLGADAYFVKPYDMAELLEKIKALVQ